jgi:hypothetical protein
VLVWALEWELVSVVAWVRVLAPVSVMAWELASALASELE